MAMSSWNTPVDEVASVKVKEEIASEITPFEEVVLVKVEEEAAASDEEPQDDPLACGDDPLTNEDSVLPLAQIPYVDNQGTSTVKSEEGPVAHIAAVFLDVKKEDATAHSRSSAAETKPAPKKRGKRKMLFCHLCSFKSVRPSRLEIHMRTHTGNPKERGMAMPRRKVGSCGEEEKRMGIRPQKSVLRIRQIYAEALQKVFNKFDETDPSCAASQDKEREALAVVEVVAASFESVSRTLNPLMLRLVCGNGQQCTEQLASMLPEFRMLRMRVERMRQEVDMERSAHREAQAEVRRLLEVGTQLRAQLQDSAVTPVEQGRAAHTEFTKSAPRKRRHTEQGSSSRYNSTSSKSLTSSQSTTSDQASAPLLEKKTPEAPTHSSAPAAPSRRTAPRSPTKRAETPPPVGKTVSWEAAAAAVAEPPSSGKTSQMCPICTHPTAKLFSYRCGSCKEFWQRLIKKFRAGTLQTSCSHLQPQTAVACIHCRRRRYELEVTRRFPERRLMLPRLFPAPGPAEDGGFQRGEECKPLGGPPTPQEGQPSGDLPPPSATPVRT